MKIVPKIQLVTNEESTRNTREQFKRKETLSSTAVNHNKGRRWEISGKRGFLIKNRGKRARNTKVSHRVQVDEKR